MAFQERQASNCPEISSHLLSMLRIQGDSPNGVTSRYISPIDAYTDGKRAAMLYDCRGVKHVILDNLDSEE